MKRIQIQPLADEELHPQLEARATIVFDGQTIQWHEIERQVERLGFEALYVVSVTQGPLGDNPKISLKPDLTGGLSKQMLDAFSSGDGRKLVPSTLSVKPHWPESSS